jgi:septum formation protein
MTGFIQTGRPPLILASTSQTRARLLEAAGLAFIAEAPGLDEAAMREAIGDERALDADDVAEVLARAKAEAVSEVARGAYVIGGDQVATNGETVWSHTDAATLTMRQLSPEFVGHYMAVAGESVLSTVGAYQIESIGIQLFQSIDGDFFSILGLPLLPLLEALRREGVIEI